MPSVVLEMECQQHPKYHGVREPAKCPACQWIYNLLHGNNVFPTFRAKGRAGNNEKGFTAVMETGKGSRVYFTSHTKVWS